MMSFLTRKRAPQERNVNHPCGDNIQYEVCLVKVIQHISEVGSWHHDQNPITVTKENQMPKTIAQQWPVLVCA